MVFVSIGLDFQGREGRAGERRRLLVSGGDPMGGTRNSLIAYIRSNRRPANSKTSEKKGRCMRQQRPKKQTKGD